MNQWFPNSPHTTFTVPSSKAKGASMKTVHRNSFSSLLSCSRRYGPYGHLYYIKHLHSRKILPLCPWRLCTPCIEMLTLSQLKLSMHSSLEAVEPLQLIGIFHSSFSSTRTMLFSNNLSTWSCSLPKPGCIGFRQSSSPWCNHHTYWGPLVPGYQHSVSSETADLHPHLQ